MLGPDFRVAYTPADRQDVNIATALRNCSGLQEHIWGGFLLGDAPSANVLFPSSGVEKNPFRPKFWPLPGARGGGSRSLHVAAAAFGYFLSPASPRFSSNSLSPQANPLVLRVP